MPGPTGVTSAAANDATGTAAMRSSFPGGCCRSRARPTTATAPMTRPTGHIPWHITQTHVIGTSCHGARPVVRARIQVAVVSTTRM